MSIHQPIKLPVTVYSSDDTGAPQLSAAGAAGEVKTILKACLVTGYGSKAAAGWEMQFEDGNKAVFKSADPRATGFMQRIDNNVIKGGQVTCYESMTDVDTGTNQWFDSVSGFVQIYGATQSVKWWVLATSTSYLLLTETFGSGQYRNASMLFGDALSMGGADTGNCLCYTDNIYAGVSASKTDGPAGGFTYSGCRIARKYNAGAGGYQPAINTVGRSPMRASDPIFEHQAHPVYYGVNGSNHVMLNCLLSSKREVIRANVQSIGGREYLIANLNNRNDFVYFIPTDYWLL